MNAASVVELPLRAVGLDPRPQRQIRPLDEAGVLRLMEETDPKSWDPIIVRRWPASDPCPANEGPYKYQVVAGYHRLTAARRLRRATIRAEIRDVPTDADFLVLALASNLRHGVQMTRDQQVAVLRRLREVEQLSLGDLAKRTGIPKGTLQTWLSSRDQNAATKVRQATLKAPGERREDSNGAAAKVSTGLRAEMPSHDERAIAAVGSAWADLGLGTSSLWRCAPGAVAGWLTGLGPDRRAGVLAEAEQAIAWLLDIQAALHGTADTANEPVADRIAAQQEREHGEGEESKLKGMETAWSQ